MAYAFGIVYQFCDVFYCCICYHLSLISEYVPYSFAYFPLQTWFLVTGILIGLYFIVLLRRVHGITNGLRKAVYLLPFIAFSQYGLVVSYKV